MPWEPWLQLNWELQNGREIATEVRSAGRKLESGTAIQKASEKRCAEWRGSWTKSFPTKWHRKKSSDVRRTGILWTLSRLRGNNSQTSFPTYSAINMHSPDTPRLPSHLSLRLQGSWNLLVFCPWQGQTHLTLALADENPYGFERRSRVRSRDNTWMRRENSKACEQSDELKLAWE